MRIYIVISSCLIALCTFLPLMPTGSRWIRILDYPVLQLAAWTVLNLVLVAAGFGMDRNHRVALFLLLAASLAFQAWTLFPYLPFSREQVLAAGSDRRKGDDLSLLIVNIRMTNRNDAAFRKLAGETNPDVILLTEPDRWWDEQLKGFASAYPHQVRVPQENTYGMMLFSRLPLTEKTVHRLVHRDVPSIQAVVELPSGRKAGLFCVHPRPPTEADTDYRDAELLLAARKMKRARHPGIIAGDLNDVAWSRTTRLFQKESRMLDPRAGRGFFNTYHAKFPLLRYPLDHVFHGSEFTLVEIKRLPSPGSDHFPILIGLNLLSKEAEAQEPLPKTGEDVEEVEEKLQEVGKQGTGG